MATALATIQDVEAVSRPVPAADIANVTRLLEMITYRVRRYTKQVFDLVEDDTIVLHPRTGQVRLPQRPVVEITELTQGGTALAADQYEVTDEGYLRRVWPSSLIVNAADTDCSPAWSGLPLAVVYTHGYLEGEFPDDVAGVVAEKAAVKWLAGARLAEGVTSESIDGYALGFANLAHVTAGNAWDPEHKEILDSYRGGRTGTLRLG